MINFIIGSNHNLAVNIKSLIESYMMNFDIEVKYHLFYNYNEIFDQKPPKIIGFKVFIMIDDELNNGIKATKFIRNILDDWNSIIILVSNNENLNISDKRLYIFDCITNNSNLKIILREDLSHIIKNYDNREKCLTFESNRVIKKIDFKSIDMIIKEKDSKKCIIKATHGNYYIPETLSKVGERLDNRFVKISRSCIINGEKITEYDKSKNKLTLRNGIVSFDISRDYKKKVSNYVINYK